MGKTIALANQKGGVGKTTSSVNLAASLAASDRSVLLVDLDPQGNATMGSGINKNALTSSINEVLLEKADIYSVLANTKAGYDLIPTNGELTEAEVQLLHVNRSEHRLRQVLSKLRGSYDYLLIDCPPSLNMLTVNALVAADSVLIPMQCEYYALEGLSALLKTIERLRASINPQLHVEGILRTMYDGRTKLTQDVSEQLTSHFGLQVFETVIPRNVRLAEAPSFGLPALLYDKSSQGAQAYMDLATEILQRREKEL